jgi:hypothetical protein
VHSFEGQAVVTAEVVGDRIPALASLPSCDRSAGARVLVVGVDGRDVATARGVKEILHQAETHVARHHRNQRHIVIVVQVAHDLDDHAQRSAHRWAGGIHTARQRARGAEVSVVLLLIDPATPPTTVQQRIDELKSRPVGVNCAVVLTGEEIRHEPIAVVSARDYI